MMNGKLEVGELTAKVVVLGTPGVGKAGMVKAVAESFGGGAVHSGGVGGARVIRTEVRWPERLADGRQLRVGVYAISGTPEYHAVGQLVLTGAEGIVFAASLVPEEAGATREALRAMVSDAGRLGLNLGAMPIAMQYHRKPGGGMVDPREMERWLGVTPGAVASYVTGAEAGKDPGVAVKGVLADLARRHGQTARAA